VLEDFTFSGSCALTKRQEVVCIKKRNKKEVSENSQDGLGFRDRLEVNYCSCVDRRQRRKTVFLCSSLIVIWYWNCRNCAAFHLCVLVASGYWTTIGNCIHSIYFHILNNHSYSSTGRVFGSAIHYQNPNLTRSIIDVAQRHVDKRASFWTLIFENIYMRTENSGWRIGQWFFIRQDNMAMALFFFK